MTSSRDTPSDHEDAPVLVLADDDDDSRTLLASRARAAGFRTYEASTGSGLVACVRALLARGERIGVILSDINMPEGDGIEATRQLLGLCSSLRIVLMSAITSATVVRSALQAGAKAVLCKPIAISAALALIVNVVQ